MKHTFFVRIPDTEGSNHPFIDRSIHPSIHSYTDVDIGFLMKNVLKYINSAICKLKYKDCMTSSVFVRNLCRKYQMLLVYVIQEIPTVQSQKKSR